MKILVGKLPFILMKNLQKNKFKVGGNLNCKGQPMVLTQTMLTSQIVDTITKALTGTTISNTTNTSSDTSNKTAVDQKGGGISDLTDSIFSGISGVFGSIFSGVSSIVKGPIIVIGVIVVLLAILAYVFRGSISKIAESKAGVSFGAMLFGKKTRIGRRRR